ncbi:MAG: amidohydrolase family protein [Phycisphaerales bacterium]|nr:amidohydrolase family protein [Phycisphaerales bacterium]
MTTIGSDSRTVARSLIPVTYVLLGIAMLLQGRILNDAFRPPIPGWLLIQDQRIVEVGHGQPPSKPDAGDASSIICPGFIDAHLHLPQIDSIGYDGLDLLHWLEEVIFPAEALWQDESWAARQVETAYGRLLRAGTLGYAGFLSSHFHGYVHVVRTGHHWPIRAIVGQTLMDRNAPPALLNQSLARIASSVRSRVNSSINPRFALTCSDELLALAKSRAAPGTYIQTHLAESELEVQRVRVLFPNDPHYAGIYDRHGLLTPHTLLAHSVHLNDAEWQLIAERKSVVVHCPTANIFLRSGVFDLDKARRFGVRLAVGSDIAAGPDLSMPAVARSMIETAKFRTMTIDGAAYIPSPAEVWNLITRGNAEALGWHDAGRIEIGAAADLLVLNPPFQTDDHLVEQLLYTWRDDYIVARIAAGRFVNAPPSPKESFETGPSSRTLQRGR